MSHSAGRIGVHGEGVSHECGGVFFKNVLFLLSEDASKRERAGTNLVKITPLQPTNFKLFS